MPVHNKQGRVVAAINVSAHVSRISKDKARREFLPPLQEAAAAIERDLRPDLTGARTTHRTSMLHTTEDEFDAQLQLSQLRWVATSHAGAAGLAENYEGLPIGYWSLRATRRGRSASWR